MSNKWILCGLFSACCCWAQLIAPGAPVLRTPLPPVVFVNGFEESCPSSFANTFGVADQVLEGNGEATLFFDTCSLPITASIEDLGVAFGQFLSGLKFQDGQPVKLVDVVAHSMGGLVLRSYLSGKQNAFGQFNPPASTGIRKAVFLATPHFGTPLALLAGGTVTKLQELASGSQFLFDLATWNQGTDDLRGVDAIAAAGNAGTGLAVMAGFDDGVVALTSASLRFYHPGRTRVLPLCHVGPGGLLGFTGLCQANAAGIAAIQSASDPTAQIVTSFLNGTNAWQSVGSAAEDNVFLGVDGGLDVAESTPNGSLTAVTSVTATSASVEKKLNVPSGNTAYTDLFPAGQVSLDATSAAGSASRTVTLAAGGTQAFLVKAGPRIDRVLPAAASVFPLNVAPGMFVAIYGASLSSQTAQASGLPFPLQLADTQTLVNGSTIPLYYVSADQIDAVIPDNATGLVKLTVQNGSGSHTVNVIVETAVPAIFTLDASGTGAAAALSAVNYQVVSASNPLHAGDSVELFATGLGQTTSRQGLDYAIQQPTVTIAGQNCPVTFAGRAPGYVGLDQINCVVPAGIGANPATPVVVTSGTRSSNVATLTVN